MKKYLEIADEQSTRFWMISLDGAEKTTRYGKIGNKGRTNVKTFGSEEAAIKDFHKQVTAKEKQGYAEADQSTQAERITSKTSQASKAPQARVPQIEAPVLQSFQHTKLTHPDNIRVLAYSMDGSRLFGVGGGTFIVWNTETGECVHRGKHNACSYAASITRAPHQDAFLIYGGYHSIADVISVKGEHLDSYIPPFEDNSSIIAGHMADTEVFLVGSSQLQIFDRKTKKVEQTFSLPFEPKDDSIKGVFSPDGRYLACGKQNESPIHIFETASGKKIQDIELNMKENSIAFSPDGSQVAIFQGGEGLSIWDTQSGKKEREWQRWEWRAYIQHISFSPDGQKILLQLSDKSICWSLDQEEKELWVRSGREAGGAMSFAPDSQRIAWSQHRRVLFCDANTGLTETHEKAPNQPYQQLFADSASGNLYAMLEGCYASHVFDTETLTIKHEIQGTKGHKSQGQTDILMQLSNGMGLLTPSSMKLRPISSTEPSFAALGPRSFASTTRENYDEKWLRIWSLSGRLLHTLEDSKKTCPSGPLCYSPNGRWLYGGKGKRLMVWDLETQERIQDIKAQPASIECMAISPDGKWLATSGRYRNVILWDATTCTIVHQSKAPKKALSLDFTWDNQHLLVGMADESQIWDVDSYQALSSVPHPCSATSVALSNDATLYIAGTDCSITALDLKNVLTPQPLESSETKQFFDFSQLDPTENLETIELALYEANWDAFDILKDTVPLRRFLTAVESKHGIHKLHHDCSDQLLQRGKRLLHSHGHKVAPIEDDISPCGRWLATGSWVGDVYEEGGDLQIWERETGRCVNIINNIDGGIGWPDYPGQIQWSPDGTELGIGFSTNAIGNFLPFSSSNEPMTCLGVTDGGNRPPGWEWTSDGRGCIVDYGGVCVASFVDGASYNTVQWFDEYDKIPAAVLAQYDDFFDNRPDYGDTNDFKAAHFTPSAYLQDMPAGMTLPSLNQSPLVLTGKNLGRQFSVDPCFPIQKDRQWHWCIAFESGLVICPPEIQDNLDEELCFTVENRFSWPVKWADQRHYAVVSTINEALAHPLLPLSESDAKRLSKTQPKTETIRFRTVPAEQNEYYNDYKDSIQVKEYQLALSDPSMYQANLVFEGADINWENVEPLLGKAVMYAENYDPNRIQVGSLLGITDEYCQIFYKSPGNASYGMSGSSFGDLAFIGEATVAQHATPQLGKQEEEAPEEGERGEFPNGKNLSKLSSSDNEHGELIIPLPFEGEDQLVLHWEKIFGFDVEEEFAEKWGKKFRELKHDCHFLGKFTYNGDSFEPEGDCWGAEHFHECRFDAHGNDAMGSNEDFDGKNGLNVTQLMTFVPKRTGQFKKQAPVTEIENIRFGRKGSYSIKWSARGGSKWTLEVSDEKLYSNEEILAFTTLSFHFDFFEMLVGYEHNFGPNDLWNS